MWKSPEQLRPLKALLKQDAEAIEREVFFCPQNDELRRVLWAMWVRKKYMEKWKWGAGPEFLYRSLIRGLGLRGLEDELSKLDKAKPGRRKEIVLAVRIWGMKAEGKTAVQMKAIFESEGQHFSLEKIESYLKTRRKKPPI
jgi:hypothetical protein